jgi:hypothetical protein
MNSVAAYMRIVNIEVSNEDVDTRKLAIESLVSNWGKPKKAHEILLKAAQIAKAIGGDGIPDPELGHEVEAEIQKHASAFLYSERPMEIGICAAVAMMELLSIKPKIYGWTVADVFAVALWSALDFQSPLGDAKREALRQEVLELARGRALHAGEESRVRLDVPSFADLTISPGGEGVFNSNFKKATEITINVLRQNAALDREELDFLWWIQLGRSRLLNLQLNQIGESVRLVTLGVEAAELLRRLPAQVHRDLVLRTLDEDPSLTLEQLIAAMGDDRETIVSHTQGDVIDGISSVFPLLHALKSGSFTSDGAHLTRLSSYWGARALLEASVARLSSMNGIVQL